MLSRMVMFCIQLYYSTYEQLPYYKIAGSLIVVLQATSWASVNWAVVRVADGPPN